jgi:hypothetical protein
MLSACSKENSTPAPTQTTSSSPSATTQGTWTASKGEGEWGTYSLDGEEFGNFSVAFPSQPSEEIGGDGEIDLG